MTQYLILKLLAGIHTVVHTCETAEEALAYTSEHVDDTDLEIYERQDNLVDFPA